MAKQLDNSFFVFAKPVSQLPQMLAAIALLALFIVGSVISAMSSNWPLFAIFAFAFVGVIVFAGLSWDRARKLTAFRNQRSIEWETAVPEIQRQNLTIEVQELARILEVEPDQITDLQSAYIVAEDLALRQIQQEESVPLLRHVSIGGVPFDAVLVKGPYVICCDVVFLVSPEIRQEKIDSIIHKISAVNSVVERMNLGLTVRLMMIVITQLSPEDRDYLVRSHDTKRFAETPVEIEIRMLDFEALQRIYVTD